jgi:predicted secreted hydrolase
MRRRAFFALPLAALAGAGWAQDDYGRVIPDRPLRFPRDHGSHADFRTEWWYATGWVTDTAGHAYGIQVTFFRNRPRVAETSASAFAPRQLLFAHAALADPRRARLLHDQRGARAGFGLAGADDQSTHVWIDDWSLSLLGDAYAARIAAREFTLDLRFTPTQSLLLQGDGGYSRKGPEAVQASYYYSRPQLAVSGTVAAGGASVDVVGTAWLDHEWSSEVMAAEGRRLGLDGHQSRGWRRGHGVPDARPIRHHLLGRRRVTRPRRTHSYRRAGAHPLCATAVMAFAAYRCYLPGRHARRSSTRSSSCSSRSR